MGPGAEASEFESWWTSDRPLPVVRIASLLRDRRKMVLWLPAPGPQEALALPSQERLRKAVRRLESVGLAVMSDEVQDGLAGLRRLEVRSDEHRCRRARPEDGPDLEDLFRRCFGQRLADGHWRWKYEQNPSRAAATVVERDGVLLGHYGGVSTRFLGTAGGELQVHQAVQMTDTMIDPAGRLVGRRAGAMLSRAVRTFFAWERQPETSFYFGFNRGSVQRFCEWFIGGRVLRPVYVWQGPLSPQVAREGGGGTYTAREIHEPLDAAWDHLARRTVSQYGLLAARDSAYLTWRYQRAPGRSYRLFEARADGELVAWAVFADGGEFIDWGYLLVDAQHQGAIASLVREASRTLGGANRRFRGWFDGAPYWLRQRLTGLGLQEEPQNQGLHLVALANPGFDLSRLEAAYTTWGDSDLF